MTTGRINQVTRVAISVKVWRSDRTAMVPEHPTRADLTCELTTVLKSPRTAIPAAKNGRQTTNDFARPSTSEARMRVFHYSHGERSPPWSNNSLARREGFGGASQHHFRANAVSSRKRALESAHRELNRRLSAEKWINSLCTSSSCIPKWPFRLWQNRPPRPVRNT